MVVVPPSVAEINKIIRIPEVFSCTAVFYAISLSPFGDIAIGLIAEKPVMPAWQATKGTKDVLGTATATRNEIVAI